MTETDYTQMLEELLTLLNPAIERWRQGDPMGYAELFSNDATYFGPGTNGQVIGREAVINHFKPFTGLIQLPKMTSSNLLLQVIGNHRILSCNWSEFDAEDNPLNTWNSSEFWSFIDDRWQIIHAHWSMKLEDM